MRTLTVLLTALLAPLLQETHDLKWSLKEGQVFTCSWTCDMKVSSPDVPKPVELKIAFGGALTVRRATPEGAVCEIGLTRYEMKGDGPNGPIDMLFEEGEVRRPDPEGAAGKNLLRECRKPFSIRINPRGEYTPLEPHVIEGFFGGQSDFFGSQLPGEPVAIGAGWEGALQSPQARARAVAAVKVRYKLDSVTDGVAKIALDDRQDLKLAGKVMDFRVVSETLFPLRGGYCSRSQATVTASDMTDPKRAKPEKPDMVTVLRFDMAPK